MVLVMLLVITTLIGTVMLVYLAQYRFVRRDVHRQQAIYTAEAAVHAALARFEDDPSWRANGAAIDVLNSEPSPRVWVRAYGGYLQIRAEASHGKVSASVLALFGQEPPGEFEHAVILGDTTTALTLTGRTEITGDVVTGPRGVRAAPLRRRPFTGRLRGEVQRVDGEPLPPYDGHLFEETVDRFERYLEGLPEALPRVPVPVPSEDEGREARARIEEERVFSDSLRILWAGDEASLAEADSALLRTPVLILSRGDLTVTGALRLAPGSLLLAGGTLRIAGPLTGDDCVLFGERVEIDGGARLSGQVLARRAIKVQGGSALRYPSVLFVDGSAFVGPAEDRIEIQDAAVHGTVVYPPHAEGGRDERVRVVLSEASRVRGSVYNGRRTEAAGRIEGTLLTAQTYFFSSPASYVNWLNGPTIDRPARPGAYVLPALFERPRMRAIAWTVSGTGAPRVSDTLTTP